MSAWLYRWRGAAAGLAAATVTWFFDDSAAAVILAFAVANLLALIVGPLLRRGSR
jgi:hypothetical protein